MRVQTTVIGSYPCEGVSVEEKQRFAVKAQRKAGVQVISDGQPRTDMISYVAEAIGAFEKKSNGKWSLARKIDENVPLDSSALKGEFAYLKGLCAAYGGEPAFMMAGPVTMAFAMEGDISGYGKAPYRNPELYRSIAEAELRLLGIDRLDVQRCAAFHIDEPFLSQSPGALEYARSAMEFLALNVKAAGTAVNLHVCGDVTKVFPKLLDLRGIDVLSHGFAGKAEKNNLRLLDEYKVSSYGKKLGFGCVDSSSPEVEPVKGLKELICYAMERQDCDIVVHPDCGLRNLPPDAAFRKLKNMCEAAGSFD
jgi:5-methyltetrahydropteroyltriglutamate--homocysteine methyltransferase